MIVIAGHHIRPFPSQSRLRELLSYDLETGIFRWNSMPPVNAIARQRNTACAGKVAGMHNTNGYVRIKIDGVKYYAHRLAWYWVYGTVPETRIDHRDHDPSNNRIWNLRAATHSQNLANAPGWSHNTSGFKGVWWNAADKRWMAEITKDKKRVRLGRFDTPDAANAAYQIAAQELFGEFASL